MTAGTEFAHCLARLRSPDPSLRREAAEALGECEDASAVTALVEGLRDESPGVQEAAMASLVRIGGARVVQAVLPLLRQDVATRNLAIEILEQVGAAGLDLLIPLATHPDPNLRKFITDTLGKLGDRRAIPTLLAKLGDRDPNVRASAADALGAMRVEEAVPTLVGMLRDEEWVVFSVVNALGDIGAAVSVNALLELIRTGSQPLRCAAIDALGRVSEACVCVEPMLALMSSADSDLRDLLVKSVVSLAVSCRMDLKSLVKPGALEPALNGALASRDGDILRTAVKGYGMIEDPRGTKMILETLERLWRESQDLSDELVREAEWALERCADEGALIAGLAAPAECAVLLAAETLGKVRAHAAVPSLARLVVTHSNREVRRVAIKALGRIAGPAAITVVIEALTDETGFVRGEAAAVLGRWKERTAIEPLCRQLAVEIYGDVRTAIVEALCAIPSQDVSDRLIELLGSEREEVREAAARGLGRRPDPGLVRALLDAANDPAWSVRAAVIEAVGRHQGQPAFDAVLLALSDDHEKVRLAAVQALAGNDGREAIEALRVHALADGNLWVRYRAVEALGAKRATEAVPGLLEIANGHREPGLLRRMAITALGLIGDERARATLLALQRDQEADLAVTAGEALAALPKGADGDDPWK
jgi:HEAT repeat protein